MKKIMFMFLLTLIVSLLSAGDSGLMIIAHGAPMPQWNQPVIKIENEVKEMLSEQKIADFKLVRVAMMEFTQPTIADIIKEMEKAGINRIYAIPLFIAPSGHSVYDVPTILGLYSDKQMVKTLTEEGIEIVNTSVSITVGPSLHYGDILKNIMLDRVKELSTDPANESLVLLAHGDRVFEPVWQNISDEICDYISAKTGIDYTANGFIGIGQEFTSKGVPVIMKASDKKDRTIVVGMYLSMGVERMANNSASFFMGEKQETKELFKDKNIVFAKRGLLPDKRIAEWIVERAVEWLK